MKEIRNYDAEKYTTGRLAAAYVPVAEGVYEVMVDEDIYYVTSLSFVQEPELGEGDSAHRLSPFPLNDILDRYLCHISDRYELESIRDPGVCRLEFASPCLTDILGLRELIGRHVFSREREIGGKVYGELVVE